MAQAQRRRIAVITVHGTGDTAAGPDGDKWFQTGSAFVARLRQRLSIAGIEADIIPLLWSGANSAVAREKGAGRLGAAIVKAGRDYDAVHVIGHSHGGNVAVDTAKLIGWRSDSWFRRYIFWAAQKSLSRWASVTTVGAPFLKGDPGRFQVLSAIAFLLLIVASYFAIATGFFDLISSSTIGELQQAWARSPRDHLIFVANALALLLAFPFASQAAFRVLSARARPNQRAQVFTIHHPNDEAIAFLQRVEGVKIEPFPGGAFWRGSRTLGLLLGVWAALIFTGVSHVAFGLSLAGVEGATRFVSTLGVEPPHQCGILRDAKCDGLFQGISLEQNLPKLFLFAPLAFAAGYLAWRLLGGLGIEFGLRGVANNIVSGSLRGMALGRDGDLRLGRVSTVPHAFGAKSCVLEGEIAKRMQLRATEAANRLLDKYRWALFSVGSEASGAVNDIAMDAMTWDSLIHTTYFDQPEVADLIADHIVSQTSLVK